MKMSLKKKTILLFAFIGLAVNLAAIAVFDRGIHDVIRTLYENHSADILKAAASALDIEKIEIIKESAMKADGNIEKDQITGLPEYLEINEQLKQLKETFNVKRLSIVCYDPVKDHLVCLSDTSGEAGTVIPAADHIRTKQAEIMKSEDKDWIIRNAAMIAEEEEKPLYLTVETAMGKTMLLQQKFEKITAAIFTVLMIVLCFIGIRLVEYFVVLPINRLSDAAIGYVSEGRHFTDLDIRSSDEIGTLADSMKQMDRDISSYIENLISIRERADEMEEAATIDALTQVRNKRAFDSKKAELKDEYGLAVIDLNNLKIFNDSYGHDKGDIAIKNLCFLVCEVFKHSPVYRIGGDEFVVVLEDRDYENRESLFAELERKIKENPYNEKLEPWEKITAAVGCAVHEKESTESVDEVLKRADQLMYENKKEMKNRRS